jgi:hypothetical protein
MFTYSDRVTDFVRENKQPDQDYEDIEET